MSSSHANKKGTGYLYELIIIFTVPARSKRTGIEIRLLIDGAGGGGLTH